MSDSFQLRRTNVTKYRLKQSPSEVEPQLLATHSELQICHRQMRTKKEMRHYLKQWRSDIPLAAIVLKHGEWFLGCANVDDYEIAKEFKKSRRPRAQQCFYNAQQFCIDHRGFKYFEGYMLIPGWPMHHAWVVMRDGKVVDFTLEAMLRKAKREHGLVDTTPPLYYGVEVPRTFIMKRLIEVGCGEPIAELCHLDL